MKKRILMLLSLFLIFIILGLFAYYYWNQGVFEEEVIKEETQQVLIEIIDEETNERITSNYYILINSSMYAEKISRNDSFVEIDIPLSFTSLSFYTLHPDYYSDIFDYSGRKNTMKVRKIGELNISHSKRLTPGENNVKLTITSKGEVRKVSFCVAWSVNIIKVEGRGYSKNKKLNNRLDCEKEGFEPNTKKGIFTMPGPRIYTETKSLSFSNYPELHGEFFFWHWGGSQLEGSLLDIKIQVTLADSQLSNELIFYRSGIAHTWATFFNISDGDIIGVNSFPSNFNCLPSGKYIPAVI